LTNAWADLGDELFVRGAEWIALYVVLDINDSQNARVRLLAKLEADGANEYSLPIRTVAADVVRIEPEIKEFNVDADQSIALSWHLDKSVSWVQFQVQAGVVGAVAGQIDLANVTTGRG
ncbi:unnamed protein product, partial [marine sediment metagenome]